MPYIESGDKTNLVKIGAEMYGAYLGIMSERIDQYGFINTENDKISGVAFAKLLDIDGNGLKELVICYNSDEFTESDNIDASSSCVYEIWGYESASYLIAKENITVFCGGSSLWGTLDILEKDGKFIVINALTIKTSYDMNNSYHTDYVVGSFVDGTWIVNTLQEIPENICTETPLFSFDGLKYLLEDKMKLIYFYLNSAEHREYKS